MSMYVHTYIKIMRLYVLCDHVQRCQHTFGDELRYEN